ncbi:unnamed protein product, partial [Tilletia controversa]
MACLSGRSQCQLVECHSAEDERRANSELHQQSGKRMFAPRAGQKAEVVFNLKTMEPLSIQLQDATRSFGPNSSNFAAVRMSKDPSSKMIKTTISEERRGESVPLELEYIYRPDQPFAPIHESMEGRNDRVR